MPRRSRIARPADGPGVDQPLRLSMRGVEHLVMRDAEFHAAGLRRVDKGLALAGPRRERLFHQHVLASLQCPQGHGEMQVVRQAH